jgi:hypothetical protein
MNVVNHMCVPEALGKYGGIWARGGCLVWRVCPAPACDQQAAIEEGTSYR